METPPTYVTALIYLFIVVYMLSVTLETTGGQIIEEIKDVPRVGRAVLANFIIIPLLGVVLTWLFPMSSHVRIGFLLLAFAPGGLFALQFARVAKGNLVFAVGLLFILSLLAVLLMPTLVHLLFPTSETGRMPFMRIILLLLLLIMVPLLAGRGLQRLAPEAAPKLGRLLGTLSILLFIAATVVTGRYKSPSIKAISAVEIAAIVSLVLVSWVIGWLLGGPEVRNRKVLAISTSLRNVGVCLPIAASYFPGTDVFVPILAFSGISIPMNMLFALIAGRMLHDTEVSPRPVAA
jgi:bile acid:Na+ symporter, BASS family